MSSQSNEDQPWAWPESHWRSIVNAVRAGAVLRPRVWPGEARCAVALSFDSDHETNELRDGGKLIPRLMWGQFGNRVAVPAILRILARYSVPATFFVPAVTAQLHPEEQRRIVADGHEIGIHGWIHEMISLLPPGVESDLMKRSADALEKITGVRAVGFRTPSMDFTAETLVIAKALGLEYDSSLMADEDCHELLLHGEPTGLVEVPIEWLRDDATYFWMERARSFRPYTAPQDVFDIFRREFDAAYEQGGLFQLVMHPHVIGYRSRIWILEEIIRHARSRSDVWFGTHAEVARWARQQG